MTASGSKKRFVPTRRYIGILTMLVVIVGGLVVLWKATPVGEVLSPRHIAAYFDAIDDTSWVPLVFIAAFLVGGLIMFPVTVLSAATAISLPPLKAAPISFTGMMLSAALLHWIGARFIRKPGRKMLGKTVKKIDGALKDKSILTIASLRMLPLAPFTLVNVAAGALGVRFSDYMIGSALGLAPGLIMMCLFGRQVRAFWKNPSSSGVMIAIAVALMWMGISLALQKWAARRAG